MFTEKPAREPPVKKVEPAGATPALRAPYLRSSVATGYRQTVKTRQMRNQKHNVNSVADFPTLGGALECEASSRDGFVITTLSTTTNVPYIFISYIYGKINTFLCYSIYIK